MPAHSAPPTVVVAPDSFKGSIDAIAATRQLALGIRGTSPEIDVREVPMADGGEGTVDVLLAAGWDRVQTTVSGPLGDRVEATYARSGPRCVIELAQAAGLHLSPVSAASAGASSTVGVGELIGHALDDGADQVVLALGGSATTDGGAGMLAALGARLDGVTGTGGTGLVSLTAVDTAGLHPGLNAAELVLITDVDHALLGPQGAAAIFAPQKGADAETVRVLEAGLTRWVEVVADAGHDAHRAAAAPGAGAAGGAGFAALVLGARRESGAQFMVAATGLADRLEDAALVITGEGKLDSQSLAGKTPVSVAQAAGRRGVPAIAVAGVCDLTPEQAGAAGFSATYSLSDLEPDPQRSIAHAGELLERLGAQIGAERLA